MTELIIKYNGTPENASIEIPFWGRNVLESSLTCLLGRLDPFRLITVFKVQSDPAYDLGKKAQSAVEWSGDILARNRERNLWSFDNKKESFDRALLGNYVGEIIWKPGFRALSDRNLANKFSKPLEILEYAGFISKREASRGMKQGGRGTRYVVNLCNTLEKVPGARLTRSLYEEWINATVEDIQFAANNIFFAEIELPEINIDNNLGILNYDIGKLKKSNVFPYGLTDDKIEKLKAEGYLTVGQLAECTENDLRRIYGIGDRSVEKIKNVVDQAIWM